MKYSGSLYVDHGSCINAFLIGGVSLEKLTRPIEPGDIDTDIAVQWAEEQFQSGEGFLDGELVWGAMSSSVSIFMIRRSRSTGLLLSALISGL